MDGIGDLQAVDSSLRAEFMFSNSRYCSWDGYLQRVSTYSTYIRTRYPQVKFGASREAVAVRHCATAPLRHLDIAYTTHTFPKAGMHVSYDPT